VLNRFQILNLADPGPDAGVRRKGIPTPRDKRLIRSCLSFTIPHGDGEMGRETLTRRVCDGLADGMRSLGFDTSKARPGKPWDSVFRVRFEGFRFVVMLVAKARPRVVSCKIQTWTSCSRWKHVSADVIASDWARTYSALENVLLHDFKADSLKWIIEEKSVEPNRTSGRPPSTV